MISVSEKYKELLESNIRYECHPTIRILGRTNDNEIVDINFDASKIKDLQFTSFADPLGKENSYMELTWSEVFNDKIGKKESIKKYENVSEHMAVQLSFKQNLQSFNTWGLLYKLNKTWKNLYNDKKTWKKLKGEVEQEKIDFPVMFLVDKPKVEGNLVKWVARDALHFLNENQILVFDYEKNRAHNHDIIKQLLENQRKHFNNDTDPLYSYIGKTIYYLDKYPGTGTISGIFGLSGNSRDLLRKYGNVIGNTFVTFISPKKYGDDFMVFNDGVGFDIDSAMGNPAGPIEIKKIKLSHMYKYPTLKFQKKIKDFYFSLYSVENVKTNDDNTVKSFDNKEREKYSITYYDKQYGDFIEENNDLMVTSQYTETRSREYIRLVDDELPIINCEIIHDLSIEPGDIISCETNTYDESGKTVSYNGVLVKNSISYNGAIKQNIVVNAVSF